MVDFVVARELPRDIEEDVVAAMGVPFYASPAWLRYVQHEIESAVRYVVATSGGRSVAVLPVYLEAPTNPRYDLGHLLEGVADAARYALAGGIAGYWAGVCWTAHLPPVERLGVLEGLLQGAQDVARSHGFEGVALLYLTDVALSEVRALEPRHTFPLAQDAVLDIEFEGLAEYVDWLPSRKRRQVRSDLEGLRSEDVVIERCSLESAVLEMAPMVSNVQRKYGHNDTTDDCVAGLRAQARWLNDLGHVFLARDRAGEPLGCSLFYHFGDALYGRVVGFAEARHVPNLYFALYFYEPVDLARDVGARSLYFGLASLEAKTRRGAAKRTLSACIFPLR